MPTLGLQGQDTPPYVPEGERGPSSSCQEGGAAGLLPPRDTPPWPSREGERWTWSCPLLIPSGTRKLSWATGPLPGLQIQDGAHSVI